MFPVLVLTFYFLGLPYEDVVTPPQVFFLNLLTLGQSSVGILIRWNNMNLEQSNAKRNTYGLNHCSGRGCWVLNTHRKSSVQEWKLSYKFLSKILEICVCCNDCPKNYSSFIKFQRKISLGCKCWTNEFSTSWKGIVALTRYFSSSYALMFIKRQISMTLHKERENIFLWINQLFI